MHSPNFLEFVYIKYIKIHKINALFFKCWRSVNKSNFTAGAARDDADLFGRIRFFFRLRHTIVNVQVYAGDFVYGILFARVRGKIGSFSGLTFI